MTGPGRLVLIVGPSGAGKDTLIAGARLLSTGDPNIIFPRRVVTRPASLAEDHVSLDANSFNQAVACDAFAFWWDAHETRYGIPSSIDDDLRAGRTIVCNVSRAIIDTLRSRYARICVVLITAPREILKSRLTARRRSTDGDIGRRIARSAEVEAMRPPDHVICNIGAPQLGAQRLFELIRAGD